MTPECKPITCGRPPESPNAVAHLVNGSTLWQSVAGYSCKPGFSAVVDGRKVAAVSSSADGSSKNDIVATSVCGESGLWEPPVRIDCRFDPDAAAGQIEGNNI